jgi:hypothetical protein
MNVPTTGGGDGTESAKILDGSGSNSGTHHSGGGGGSSRHSCGWSFSCHVSHIAHKAYHAVAQHPFIVAAVAITVVVGVVACVVACAAVLVAAATGFTAGAEAGSLGAAAVGASLGVIGEGGAVIAGSMGIAGAGAAAVAEGAETASASKAATESGAKAADSAAEATAASGASKGGERAETAAPKSGAGSNAAQTVVSALRASGQVGAKRNIAAAEVSIHGQDSYLLSSVSGDAERAGTVATVGAEGNPQRFVPQTTGSNTRFSDTEFKLLNHIANRLGPSSESITGSINLHSERPLCDSCSSIVSQFRETFPGIDLNVTTG